MLAELVNEEEKEKKEENDLHYQPVSYQNTSENCVTCIT
jgi:hypothetical protein